MTADRIRQAVFDVLGEIAPEADLAALDPQESFRDQLDIDSMDFLNFVIGIDKRLGLEIPEIDYPKLASMESCIEYLEAHRV
jgi:acyl carrier protein